MTATLNRARKPIGSLSTEWSQDHGTWILTRYTDATGEREILSVHPTPLAPHARGTLGPWLAEATAGLNKSQWCYLTDVYGYYEHATEYDGPEWI